MRRATFILFLSILLSGCASPFAPVILAPVDTPVISSPQELPEKFCNQPGEEKMDIVSWTIGKVRLCTGTVIKLPSSGTREEYSEGRFFQDGRYFVYIREFVNQDIGIIDVETGKVETLFRKSEFFPDAVTISGVAITPDGRRIIFVVLWPDEVDLVKIDLANKQLQRLYTDVLVTGFGHPDISQDEKIVVKCAKVSGTKPVSELCLLNENGKFIRYLTAEGYPWPGNGRFTPDGKWVVYESRYKLYKVRVDGSGRQEIAPCSAAGPEIVTNSHVITSCYISAEPYCEALFIASLDGTYFRRIGYLEPVCVSK